VKILYSYWWLTRTCFPLYSPTFHKLPVPGAFRRSCTPGASTSPCRASSLVFPLRLSGAAAGVFIHPSLHRMAFLHFWTVHPLRRPSPSRPSNAHSPPPFDSLPPRKLGSFPTSGLSPLVSHCRHYAGHRVGHPPNFPLTNPLPPYGSWLSFASPVTL